MRFLIVHDAYEALTEKQQEEITGAEVFEILFAFFNGMPNLLEAKENYNIEQEAVTLTDNCAPNCSGHTITGTGQSTANTITVESGTHNIILQDVNINVSSGGAAFSIKRGAAVNLTLSGTNTLKSGYGCAGLQVPDGAELVITESSASGLNAAGGSYAAGIGGGMYSAGGKITIRGGTVDATGGYQGVGGVIEISGGRVTATGVYTGAGIGGESRNGGTIIIKGGNLLYSGVDPKTVQYLAGHENSKTTMDIYAKVKYNKPEELFAVVNGAFHQAFSS